MILSAQKYLNALNRIVENTDYVFLIKVMRGVGDFMDPWYDFPSMKHAIDSSQSPHKATLRLLHMGIDAENDQLEHEIGRDDIDLLIEAGIWRRENGKIKTNNLVLLLYQGLRLLTEINPWYETCSDPNTDVYIGADSLRLADNIVFRKGAVVLDLCSGTGIQGLLAARSAKKVVSVELNPKAVPVTRFNIRFNGLEDVIDLREGDLYNVLGQDEHFDYIYANPPFIPMTDNVSYPVCGSGGEDGLMVLNRIFDGLSKHLKPGGEAIIFCECLGNDREVFFYKKVERLAKANKWRVNVLSSNRIEADYQKMRTADLTLLFNKDNDEFSPEALCQKLSAIYQKLGATYLYSLIFKIDACQNGDGCLRHINQYNAWDKHDKASVAEGLTLEENKDSQAVMIKNRQIGVFNNETADILEQLSQGNTVQQTADILWEKYRERRKYQKYGYAAFLTSILSACLQMELIGAITCLKDDSTAEKEREV